MSPAKSYFVTADDLSNFFFVEASSKAEAISIFLDEVGHELPEAGIQVYKAKYGIDQLRGELV